MGLKEWKDKFFPQIDDGYGDGIDVDADSDDVMDEPTRTPVSERIPESTGYGRVSDGNVPVVAPSRSSIEMKVVTPTKFEAVTQIADLLLNKKTVLLNLENTNKETAKRLIDFLSGVAYALGGDIQKVADNTFAVTPNNVAVSNEEIESDPYTADDEQYE